MSKYYKAEDVGYAIRMKYARAESEEREEVISEICRLISDLPTIEVSEGGKWIRKEGRVWSECSVCGSGSSFETRYCGSCGARMKEADK